MTPTASLAPSPSAPALAGFWDMDEAEREDLLLRGIVAAHTYHYARNTAYRNTVAARGIGPRVAPADVSRLLRTTSQAFKSYVDILGTPFPQDRPEEFVRWLAEQMSVEPRTGAGRAGAGPARSRYRSLEGLLRAVERHFSGLGVQMLTSSGTSGRVSLIPRDRIGADLAAEGFSLSLQRYLGVTAGFTAILTTPKRTRMTVPLTARSGVERIGLAPERVHFTMPYSAGPDGMRVRLGLTYRPGWRGAVERHISHPVLTALQGRLADAQAVESTISRLIPAGAHEEKVLLFGSLTQLHKVASFLLDAGRTITLAPGSVLATWGGAQGAAAAAPAGMRQDLRDAFRLTGGEPVPLRDVYSLAEAGWAAMQCSEGNYHIAPWVYAVTLDNQGAFQKGPRSTGLLAFFDPYGAGDLFPAFFRTTDRVTLVQGLTCPCGQTGSHLEKASVQRLGLPGTAGRGARP